MKSELDNNNVNDAVGIFKGMLPDFIKRALLEVSKF